MNNKWVPLWLFKQDERTEAEALQARDAVHVQFLEDTQIKLILRNISTLRTNSSWSRGATHGQGIARLFDSRPLAAALVAIALH